MKYTVSLFFAFFCAVSALFAQIALTGKVSNLPESIGRTVVLEYWVTDRWQSMDEIQLKPDGSFTTIISTDYSGQCRLRVRNKSKNWSDFLMITKGPTRDSVLKFDLDFNKMSGDPAHVEGSTENALYEKLSNANRKAYWLRDSTQDGRSEAVQKAEKELNTLCRSTWKEHSGTFAGDIVARLLYLPQPEDYPGADKLNANAFAIAHALDLIPFYREQVLYHNSFFKIITRYGSYFDQAGPDITNLMDHVMAHRSGTDAVDGYLFSNLLDDAIAQKNEAGLTYLLTHFVPDCTDEKPLPNSTQNLLQALKSCTPGNLAPEVQLPDTAGHMITLSNVCAQNKITLLLFWRSTCPHCEEFEPVLAGIYEKYHPLGVEVYALSTDRTELNWKEYLQRKPNKWINVIIPMEMRNTISRQFPAPSTPTLIAVDRDRKVLSRLILRSNLESYLDETLKKVK